LAPLFETGSCVFSSLYMKVNKKNRISSVSYIEVEFKYLILQIWIFQAYFLNSESSIYMCAHTHTHTKILLSGNNSDKS
jgi:hypothetical protein